MRKPQKTTILFILIFLIGIVGFIAYINSSFDTESESPIAIPATEDLQDPNG